MPGFRLFGRGELGPDQDGHLRAEPGEKLRLLQRHIPAAHHQHRSGNVLQLHRTRGRQIIHLVHSRHFRDPGGGAGRDQVVFRADCLGGSARGGDVQNRCGCGSGEHRRPPLQVPSIARGEIHILL